MIFFAKEKVTLTRNLVISVWLTEASFLLFCIELIFHFDLVAITLLCLQQRFQKKKKYSENNCDLFRTFHDHNFAEKDFMRAFELAWLRVELKSLLCRLKITQHFHNTLGFRDI